MQATLTSRREVTSGRFAALMELYESNYILLRRLIPNLTALEGGSEQRYLSWRAGAVPLELSAIEHSRYTSSFRLSYRFSSRRQPSREPDLTIRLYHDARSAEVMTGLLPSSRRDARGEPRRRRDLGEGMRLNRFFNRWLAYCLRQGHSFDVEGALREGATNQSAQN
ncbi:MAG: hypothetical protein CSB44_12315 [Gammaproteobacteria bacterium]|nr:MAG: hypothetical protein CSB44_12315 [Gammaproteobacteria bacterium]